MSMDTIRGFVFNLIQEQRFSHFLYNLQQQGTRLSSTLCSCVLLIWPRVVVCVYLSGDLLLECF